MVLADIEKFALSLYYQVKEEKIFLCQLDD